jgi:hypothetical protein
LAVAKPLTAASAIDGATSRAQKAAALIIKRFTEVLLKERCSCSIRPSHRETG